MSKYRTLDLTGSAQVTQNSEWVNTATFHLFSPKKEPRMKITPLWAIDPGLTLLYFLTWRRLRTASGPKAHEPISIHFSRLVALLSASRLVRDVCSPFGRPSRPCSGCGPSRADQTSSRGGGGTSFRTWSWMRRFVFLRMGCRSTRGGIVLQTRQYAICRVSVPLRARVFGDLVDHCEEPEGRIVGSGGRDPRPFVLERECRRARGFGILRSEVLLVRRPEVFEGWQACVENASYSNDCDVAATLEALDGPYVVDADENMSWDEGRCFVEVVRRRCANLSCYRGRDLSGVGHSLCEEGTPSVVVQAMLQKARRRGEECSWCFAYRSLMDESGSGVFEFFSVDMLSLYWFPLSITSQCFFPLEQWKTAIFTCTFTSSFMDGKTGFPNCCTAWVADSA